MTAPGGRRRSDHFPLDALAAAAGEEVLIDGMRVVEEQVVALRPVAPSPAATVRRATAASVRRPDVRR